MTLVLTSSAFAAGEAIPSRHTGEGDDVSPPLVWTAPPANTREICLLVEDPDAPRPQPWVHWLVAGLPAGTTSLAEGVRQGFVEGHNDFGDIGWGGPMPPKGHGVHRYIFKVMAVDRPTSLRRGFSKRELLDAIAGHVLADGQLTGTYRRD